MSLVKRAPVFVLLAVTLVVSAQAVFAQDESLEELLAQVGPVYGEAYISPFIHAHGANQNSGLFHTANFGGQGLHISIGIKVMATHLNADDQTFRRVLDNVPLSDFLPEGDPNFDDTGTIVMDGPTVFGKTGDENKGTITAYVDGIPVYAVSTIPGLVDTRWVPLFAPQATVGNIAGVSATLRWFPEIDLSEYGKTKFFGWGLSWGTNAVFPTLPLDVMVGYFNQSLDVGSILQTSANSLFIAGSKDFQMITLYGGFAKESSTMDVSYTFIGYDDLGVDETKIDFSVDGRQEARITLGATLRVLGGLNFEYSHGKLSTYTAGLLFGF